MTVILQTKTNTSTSPCHPLYFLNYPFTLLMGKIFGYDLPRQFLLSRVGIRPPMQEHRYDPGILVHFPPPQISGFFLHSLISTIEK